MEKYRCFDLRLEGPELLIAQIICLILKMKVEGEKRGKVKKKDQNCDLKKAGKYDKSY
jgi:hypothetical protein